MIWTWLKHRRRDKLAHEPFPQQWKRIIESNVCHTRRLPQAAIRQLERRVLIFVAEKNWEGCGGLSMTDEVRVTIAGQACYLVLGFPDEYFDHLRSILVYPSLYQAPDSRRLGGSVVLEGESIRSGEAWHRGPVILAWDEALAGGRWETNGSNVVFHEFAHQLDFANGGIVDGIPQLSDEQELQFWRKSLRREYSRLVHDCARGKPTFLDCYGSQDKGEFFAVATEYFFQRPIAMQSIHPELYALLQRFFRQNPAEGEPSGFY